VQQTELPLLI